MMAIKPAISKACDRVKWGYLEAILSRMGFAGQQVDRVMAFVTSVGFDVLVNGEMVGPVVPGRGLRQGDPPHSYLFILCNEGLSSFINRAVSDGVFA